MKLKMITLTFLLGAQALAIFEHVPASHNVIESKLLWPARELSVLQYFADQPLGVYNRENGTSFPVKAIAKLTLRREVEAVNKALLDPSAKPYALVGTDFTAIKACTRHGDYDFSLRGLVMLTYLFWDKPDLLWPETREKLMNVFLTETGNKVATFRWFGKCFGWAETENHQLLTEGSRFLTNQLWMRKLKVEGKYDAFYDNEKNGMRDYFLKHFKKFLKHDFEEYNSKPYQKFSYGAIQNIFEFSEDAKVKEAARMVLDYLGAKYASSSKSLRRSTPICRQPEHRDDTGLISPDSMSQIYAMIAGNTEHLAEMEKPFAIGDWTLLGAAVGTYRPSDIVLDLIMNDEEKGREFFQTFHHLGYEVYAGSPSFLIAGGGKFVNQFDGGTGKIDGWAVPTTLIPARMGADRREMITIGHRKSYQLMHNTCVAPGFACGLNPKIPENISSDCREEVGNFTFLNFNSEKCSLKLGFYAVVYEEKIALSKNRFGFFEAREGAEISYEEFRSRVLRQNAGAEYYPHRKNKYYNSKGDVIEFIPGPIFWNQSPMVSYAGRPYLKNEKRQKLATGDYMQAEGDGRVLVNNPYLGRSLLLDYRNELAPIRKEIDTQAK